MMFKIYEVSLGVAKHLPMDDFVLWAGFVLFDGEFGDGIERVWLAKTTAGGVVGFLAADNSEVCIAIEVVKPYRNRGIGRALVHRSGCWQPEDDINPIFWGKMEQEFLECAS